MTDLGLRQPDTSAMSPALATYTAILDTYGTEAANETAGIEVRRGHEPSARINRVIGRYIEPKSVILDDLDSSFMDVYARRLAMASTGSG